MPLANSTDHGHNLQTVQMLIKKNQVSRQISHLQIAWTFGTHHGHSSYVTHAFFFFFIQTLQKEIQGHQPRIDDLQTHGRDMIPGRGEGVNAERQTELDERQAVLDERLNELEELWSRLISETEKRHARLVEAHRAQQFYTDAAEAEAWMGEQELHMMSEEKAKVQNVGL